MTTNQHDASHTITDRDRIARTVALDGNVIWPRDTIQRADDAEPIRPPRSFTAMGEKG